MRSIRKTLGYTAALAVALAATPALASPGHDHGYDRGGYEPARGASFRVDPAAAARCGLGAGSMRPAAYYPDHDRYRRDYGQADRGLGGALIGGAVGGLLGNRIAGRGDRTIGTGLYNLTWYGNARVVLEGTHHATRDTRPAERWYKRAFDLAASRELKARAAFYAAKAELHALLEASGHDPYEGLSALPVPNTWYPVLQTFSDTAYYREILAECGAFRRWAAPKPPRRR